ncbi:MAG: VanW family protein [Firmicutes bacterium]|nr:VanW family protein [Bacillota bacterium]
MKNNKDMKNHKLEKIRRKKIELAKITGKLYLLFLILPILAPGCAALSTHALSAAPELALPAVPGNGVLIGSYETKFGLGAKARNANIALAAKAVDGAVVPPGETFSYNETLGPTTKANGFRRAQIFIKGKKEYGYGGGVCQVSSTLYNAVEEAGLEVIERHSHSLPVDYVPKGKDAATSYGGIDFKFVNSLERPVRIDSYIENGTEDDRTGIVGVRLYMV